MSFKDEIIAEIRANGPMRLGTYMRRCNDHYYATRVPFGKDADFITAPDISQVFGELIGLWAADLWQRAGCPSPFNLLELGPGRGTLMQDALRATANVPGFQAAMQLHFVETSPILREEQGKRVPHAKNIRDFANFSSPYPNIIIANEFFDALPIDQKCGTRWRNVIWNGEKLAWSVPADSQTVEYATVGADICKSISDNLMLHGGALLVIDYGGFDIIGDTLQAMKAHEFADALAQPGEADLTSHVDFCMLAKSAVSSACSCFGPISQGRFLRALGLDIRTAQLAQANPARRDDLLAASARLAEPDQMGDLFKVMCITPATWPIPAGFA
jgi:NADH dehydrogenase [ubiquinone] 1 alpha subcomplex assembly factor 7